LRGRLAKKNRTSQLFPPSDYVTAVEIEVVERNSSREEMVTGTELRAKRQAAGIPGVRLARRCGRSRSYICDVELENVTPTQGELERINLELDRLLREKAAALLGAVGSAVGVRP
jgi:ribosome-binding protein aMBF1 (putative translation factor)